ncbi:hypothetical protein DPEC_G00229380 [Dallia pectoralis]|uniref:Uncharacterized protein n=1 Tax=Dallia pectoralis TaxID=75939 RepID=A0ACC2G1S8_DALPE|nr:hypothetical protein DPEC_G00229380 [Dallia pectoralis]
MATGNSMTDHLLSDHLLCSICTDVFTDPVSLSCQHTFCRDCLTESLKASQKQCPLCRNPVKENHFKVNRIIKDIVKELQRSKEAGVRSDCTELCPEHNQHLKLRCKKDKQLLCLVCRDSREHRGHQFQPLDEAREDLQKVVASALSVLRGDICKVEKLSQKQQVGVTILRGNVDTHKSQISKRFAELHEALKKMEEKELQRVEENSGLLRVGGMEENLWKITELLKRGAEREKLLQAAVECKDSIAFLRWWDHKSGSTATLKGDSLTSPSKSFPRLSLLKTWMQFRNPASLEALCRPVVEKTLKSSIVTLPTLWEPPLFGNLWDNIRLFFQPN